MPTSRATRYKRESITIGVGGTLLLPAMMAAGSTIMLNEAIIIISCLACGTWLGSRS